MDLTKEDEMIGWFTVYMLNELRKNQHKGSILDFKDFDKIITEFEYCKAKFFIAVRAKNKEGMIEYLADMGNYLVALANSFNLFDKVYNYGQHQELNIENMFKTVNYPKRDQKLI